MLPPLLSHTHRAKTAFFFFNCVQPRASSKGSYNLTAQQRLWEVLVQQTGSDFRVPTPQEGDTGAAAGAGLASA